MKRNNEKLSRLPTWMSLAAVFSLILSACGGDTVERISANAVVTQGTSPVPELSTPTPDFRETMQPDSEPTSTPTPVSQRPPTEEELLEWTGKK